MELPTQGQLERAVDAFERDWGGVDELLYGLCRKSPDHRDRRLVVAKVALIGRAYSAGLERQVKPDPDGQAITRIADFMTEHGHEVDAILAKLSPVTEPLDPEGNSMAAIVTQHGRLTRLLQGVTMKDRTPRSFAAKYLHFHRPVVPIYDSYAAAGLGKLVRWNASDVPFRQPTGGDPGYWAFCVRFLRLYNACHKAGRAVSVKGLDAYLWQVPGAQ